MGRRNARAMSRTAEEIDALNRVQLERNVSVKSVANGLGTVNGEYGMFVMGF
jgi:hypothetical protein